MASPVDTSVKHYRSDTSPALVLNDQAGSLIGILDAVLVNGYGLQTASSLVVADGVATVTLPSTFAAGEDAVVLVSGATPAALNGEQRLIATTTNTVQFATDQANGTATGTITVRVAPAGWTKAFSGTNKAVYRSADPQAHAGGMCLRVDDTGTLTARVVGYESMTDVDTGLGPFPTNAQVPGGLYWHKSTVESADAAGWCVIADSRFFLFYAQPHKASVATSDTGVTRGFGDLIALRPAGDPYAVLLSGSTTASTKPEGLDNGATTGKYVPRPYTGLGSPTTHATLPYVGAIYYSGADDTLGPFPNEITGALTLSRRYVSAAGLSPNRADIPGYLHCPQSGAGSSFSSFQKVLGSEALVGRKIMALPTSSANLTNTPNAVSFVDITGPWR